MAKRVVNIGRKSGENQFIQVENKSGCVKIGDYFTRRIDEVKGMIAVFIPAKGKARSADQSAKSRSHADPNSNGGSGGGSVQPVKGVTGVTKNKCPDFNERLKHLWARLEKLRHPVVKVKKSNKKTKKPLTPPIPHTKSPDSKDGENVRKAEEGDL